MAYTAQIGGALNVIGSFNDYFYTQVTAKGLPAFMASSVVNFDHPNRPLTYPSFSVTHLGAEPVEVAEGRNLDPGWKGVEQRGLAEISCWESYGRAAGNSPYNLRVLRDMAARVFATGAVIPVLDIYGSTVAPTANGTIIRAMPARESPLPQDPNPDVSRVRLIVPYRWLERTTAG